MSFHPSYADCVIFMPHWPHALCIWYLRHNLSVFDTAGPFFLCRFLFTCPFVSDVVLFFCFFLSLGFGLRCGVLHSHGYRRRMWRHNGVMAWLWDGKKKGRKRGETERCRVEGRSSPAGGSPQATSDIPLSDGLMRLPWHFFLPT